MIQSPTKIEAATNKAVMQQTGPYLHDVNHKVFLQFESKGDTPRSFTLLIASGVMKKGAIVPKNGITILDNDNRTVVCDYVYPQLSTVKGPSRDQRNAFSFLQGLGWREFSYFCRTRDTYRKNTSDISKNTDAPHDGCRENQVMIGALDTNEVDNRSDFIRGVHASPDLAYSFPRASRASMITEILSRDVFQGSHGNQSHLTWDIRMKYRWNQTGRVDDAKEELCPSLDRRWAQEVAENDDMMREACDAALSPYLSEPFVALEENTAMSVTFDVAGRSGGFLVMKEFAGQPLGFTSLSDFREILNGFDDEKVMHLWVASRTLDVDLSHANRAFDMAWQMHEMRLEKEQEWLTEVEEELRF